MRSDEAAVGGFAEDLPVMVFVLAGVCMLVGSAVDAADRVEAGPGDELELVAEMLVSEVIDAACVAALPTTAGLRSLNVSDCVHAIAASCEGSHLSLRSVYPVPELLLSWGAFPVERPEATGSFSRLVNALDDEGLVIVVEVRAVVW